MRQIGGNAANAVAFEVEAFRLTYDIADGTHEPVRRADGRRRSRRTGGACDPFAVLAQPDSQGQRGHRRCGRSSAPSSPAIYHNTLFTQVALRSLSFVDRYNEVARHWDSMALRGHRHANANGQKNNESGVALLSAILVLMLMSALLVGFIAMVNADQAASGINRDQTQAYAAAHAGVEKLTADLGQLFTGQLRARPARRSNALTAAAQRAGAQRHPVPAARTATSGYRITFTDNDAPTGNPDVRRPRTARRSYAGPYQGLTGLITPYTSKSRPARTGGAEVRMRRTMQTVGIPVFQFGIFSENDLSFFAGPNFAFGGRVHTNQHLFLKQDSGNTLTLQDRVTAVGEIIRTHLANGVTGTHTSDGAHGAGVRLPGGADGRQRGVPQPGRYRGQPGQQPSARRRTSRRGPTSRSAPTTAGSATAAPAPGAWTCRSSATAHARST